MNVALFYNFYVLFSLVLHVKYCNLHYNFTCLRYTMTSWEIWECYHDSTIKLILRLCLVPRKFEGKCKGRKIQKKSRRKEKVKEIKKID